MERERFDVPEEEILDYTDEDCTWEINGEKYEYRDKFRVDGDGEWWAVIVQRESDRKYFQFEWGVSHDSGRYFYEPEWCEVVPSKVTKIKWGWSNE